MSCRQLINARDTCRRRPTPTTPVFDLHYKAVTLIYRRLQTATTTNIGLHGSPAGLCAQCRLRFQRRDPAVGDRGRLFRPVLDDATV